MSILIFSKPVHSGKTTALMNWCKHQKCGGILMPNKEERKCFFNIETGKCVATEPANSKDEAFVRIGKYNFSIAAFELANDIIINAANKDFDFLVIDEIGLLELENNGFYRALDCVLKLHKTENFNGNILLVVRDVLLTKITSFFKIQDYEKFLL